MSIAIVDDGGHLLWLQRLDGAAPISAQIAPGEARTAAFEPEAASTEMINRGRVSFLSAPGLRKACSRRRAHHGRGPVHRRGGVA